MSNKRGCTLTGILLIVVGVLVLACVVSQVLALGGEQTNPPVLAEPTWDRPRTRELFMLACGDCHSNETAWPWYSKIAPVSWLIQRDVEEGRAVLNVSEWGRGENEAGEAAEIFANGEMPPRQFLILHPEARFNSGERQKLYQGLVATFGAGEEGEGGGNRGESVEEEDDD